MDTPSFRDFLRSAQRTRTPILLDGAMGTELLAAGLSLEHGPEPLNLSHPEAIIAIHRRYLEAGSQLLTTNSFGANPLKLANSTHSIDTLFAAAVRNAREAIAAHHAASPSPTPHYVLGDIGPLGQLLEPLGSLSFEDAYHAFSIAVRAAEKAGADALLLETFTDGLEMKAAILAARDHSSLPILASFSFEHDLHTLTGSDPETLVTLTEALRVHAIGFNCVGSLDDAAALTHAFARHASIPILAQPNAGLPEVIDGHTHFRLSPDAFADAQLAHAHAGALLLGGCCGTTPDHIAALATRLRDLHLPPLSPRAPQTKICSLRQTVSFGHSPILIGERINPTGKKKYREALLANDIPFVLHEAEQQIHAGAAVLDVNVGVPGLDEATTMQRIVSALQQTFPTPLQLDSSEPAVLETALRTYAGKALVNSVNGKQAVMEAVFPLIARYGGCVVALCLDEQGIPPTAEGRLAIARKILARAADYGIPPHDIFIDTLTLTISSQQREAMATLQAIQHLKTEFASAGVRTILGVSNISFGLPRREIINSVFFGMALSAGLDAAILNPLSEDMMRVYRAYRALTALDPDCLDYIQTYANTSATPTTQPTPTAPAHPSHASASDSAALSPLQEIILKGYVQSAPKAIEELLPTHSPLDILDHIIVPALDIVGHEYESGRFFLPQLLLSARTVAAAFSVLKAHLAQSGQPSASKGTILMATVEGDIHDIGKNIVTAMLENYGFHVVDLGKNVPVETIVNTALQQHIRFIGLSALMTTTVASMQKTIAALRAKEAEFGAPFHICVGGAVLTPDYARAIGADSYARNALDTVHFAQHVFTPHENP